eukprot:3460909-Rhodomonas_salina.1
MARIRETERLLARLKLAWCPSQRLKSQGKRASKLLQTCMPNTRWKWRTWGLICLLFLGVYTVFVFRWVMSVSRKHPVSHGHEAVPLKKGSAEKPGGERKKGEEKRAVETNTLNLDVLYPTEQAAQLRLGAVVGQHCNGELWEAQFVRELGQVSPHPGGAGSLGGTSVVEADAESVEADEESAAICGGDADIAGGRCRPTRVSYRALSHAGFAPLSQ